jgi:hypothetical protein
VQSDYQESVAIQAFEESRACNANFFLIQQVSLRHYTIKRNVKLSAWEQFVRV